MIVALQNLSNSAARHRIGESIPLEQVIYDPATNCAYGKPDDVLDQQRRYALFVTNGVLSASGEPVKADPGFSKCLTGRDGYCASLTPSMNSLVRRSLVGGSVFTTMAATDWMERAARSLPHPAYTITRTQDKEDVSGAVWRQDKGSGNFSDQPWPIHTLPHVGSVSFGTYQSPDYLHYPLAPGVIIPAIPPVPTGVPVTPYGSAELGFHAFNPQGEKPASGFPVVLYGHGLTDSRFGGATAFAPSAAKAGFATVVINAFGHGYGPQSEIVLDTISGTVAIPAPGRGLLDPGNGTISETSGCIVLPGPFAARDCMRQTALDQMQLVRTIMAGIDLDGDGSIDLDPNRIYYMGQSLGAVYGTMVNALEPGIRAAGLNVGGGTAIDVARLEEHPQLAVAYLGTRTPPLLNVPPAPDWGFNDNYVFRGEPVRVNTVPLAMEIQAAFEVAEWFGMPGDPLAFAPYLKTLRLPGSSDKKFLVQIAKGDREVPNPTNSALIRAADLQPETWMYRHDVARGVFSLGPNPHRYLTDVLGGGPAAGIAIAAQSQFVTFFATDGFFAPDPNGLFPPGFPEGPPLFEQPSVLPDTLNWD